MIEALRKLLHREDRAARREKTKFEVWLAEQSPDVEGDVRTVLSVFVNRKSEDTTAWGWEDVRNDFAVHYDYPGAARHIEEWAELNSED